MPAPDADARFARLSDPFSLIVPDQRGLFAGLLALATAGQDAHSLEISSRFAEGAGGAGPSAWGAAGWPDRGQRPRLVLPNDRPGGI